MTVVKVGGSLLDWPEMPVALGSWLASREGERIVLIVGGGGAADWIREVDRLHNLGPERSHQLAVRSLDLTARVLGELLPQAVVIEFVAELESAWAAGYVPIFAPREFLDADVLDPLPRSWDVTSDSIAARLAVRLSADELVILKSADCPEDVSQEDAARLGIVDPYFPTASQTLRKVNVINLRR